MEKGFIVSLIFAVIIGIFALANSERVVIDFIFTKLAMSQAIVIIISALLGALIVFIISLVKRLKLNQEIRTLRSENKKLEEQQRLIKDLKNCQDEEEKI